MDPSTVNWFAVLAAAALTFVLGGLWYSPVLFGPSWQKLNGLSDEQVRAESAKVFGGAVVCALIGSVNLAFFLGASATAGFGFAAGAATGVGWISTALATTYLFERRPGKLIAIDAGYHAVAYTLMGGLIGAWH